MTIIHVTLYYHDNSAMETIEWGQRSYTWIICFWCFVCIVLCAFTHICKYWYHIYKLQHLYETVCKINDESAIKQIVSYLSLGILCVHVCFYAIDDYEHVLLCALKWNGFHIIKCNHLSILNEMPKRQVSLSKFYGNKILFLL